MIIERKTPPAWLTYSAEAGRQDGGDVIVAVEASAFDVRLQVLSQGAKVQSMAFLSPAAAGDLRDMLTEALGHPAQARGEAHALRMIAEALQVPEAERHDGGIMRAIERLQADRDRLADIVEHKYGTDECDGCADRDLRIEELEDQLAEDLRLAMTADGRPVVVEDAGDA